MSFSPVILTGTYSDGIDPLSGTITITLSQVVTNGGLTVVPVSRVLTLDENGSFAVTLLANTDADTVPIGTFYQVTEELISVAHTGAYGASGASGASWAAAQAHSRDYSIQIPAFIEGNPVTTIDISTLMPGTPQGFDEIGNMSGTIQWTTYLDITEVLGWLQFTDSPVPGTEESALLQRVIDAACYTAQDMANRPLCPTTMFNRYDGWSGEYIQLDYSPVIKLVQCQEWQSTGGFIQLPESTPQNPIEGIQLDYRTGRIMRTFAGYSWPRPFFPGSRNIEVTYVAGYDPVPSDVWLATTDLVAYWWRNAEQASRTFVAGGQMYGGQETTPQSTGLWPGIPDRIAAVFGGYRLPVIG